MMIKNALVVDDSATMRTLVVGVLKALGYTILEAADGAAALALLGHPLSLVVTDVNMPKMDGIEFVKQLRAKPNLKALPVLMLTTETEQGVKDRARAAGATGWLTKPFAAEQLRAVVARVCP